MDFSNWRNYILPTIQFEREPSFEGHKTPTGHNTALSVTWLYRNLTVTWHSYKRKAWKS